MKTYTGTIQITEELTLNNPTMEIRQVIYDWQENECIIEIHFKEPNSALIHSRSFNFILEVDKEYTTSDVMLMISNHTILSKFI